MDRGGWCDVDCITMHHEAKTIEEFAASVSHEARATAPRVRVTVPVTEQVRETFQRLAEAGGMSTGRAMGDWLADTLDAAQFMAEKMEQARAAPRIVAHEVHAYALGLVDETSELLERVREKGRTARAQGQRDSSGRATGQGASDPFPPRSVIRGGKSPKKGAQDRGNRGAKS